MNKVITYDDFIRIFPTDKEAIEYFIYIKYPEAEKVKISHIKNNDSKAKDRREWLRKNSENISDDFCRHNLASHYKIKYQDITQEMINEQREKIIRFRENNPTKGGNTYTGVSCENCSTDVAYFIIKGAYFKCKNCGKKCSIFKGTLFMYGNIPLVKQFLQLFLYISDPDAGTYHVSRVAGVTQKSAWMFKSKYIEEIKKIIPSGNSLKDFQLLIKQLISIKR